MATVTNTLPTTIRTLSQPDPQSTEIILTTSTLPALTAGSTTEHLVRVHATSPCAGELLWPRLVPDAMAKAIVPCYDLSGTVVVAPENSPFAVGTEVWGRTNVGHSGNAREYSVAYTDELAQRPTHLDPVAAASVPLSAITAVQALFKHGGLADFKAGEEGRKANSSKRILVVAAAGGVGVWLLQLAREAGVGNIIAVCGTDNVDFVTKLGATEVIDYRKTSIQEWIEAPGDKESRKVDLVVDCKGGQSLVQSWSCARDGGVLLSICEPTEPRKPAECRARDVKNYFFIMEPRGADLADVGRLLEEGRVEPAVDSVWKLEEYKQAFEKLEDGHARGKILFMI